MKTLIFALFLVSSSIGLKITKTNINPFFCPAKHSVADVLAIDLALRQSNFFVCGKLAGETKARVFKYDIEENSYLEYPEQDCKSIAVDNTGSPVVVDGNSDDVYAFTNGGWLKVEIDNGARDIAFANDSSSMKYLASNGDVWKFEDGKQINREGWSSRIDAGNDNLVFTVNSEKNIFMVTFATDLSLSWTTHKALALDIAVCGDKNSYIVDSNNKVAPRTKKENDYTAGAIALNVDRITCGDTKDDIWGINSSNKQIYKLGLQDSYNAKDLTVIDLSVRRDDIYICANIKGTILSGIFKLDFSNNVAKRAGDAIDCNRVAIDSNGRPAAVTSSNSLYILSSSWQKVALSDGIKDIAFNNDSEAFYISSNNAIKKLKDGKEYIHGGVAVTIDVNVSNDYVFVVNATGSIFSSDFTGALNLSDVWSYTETNSLVYDVAVCGDGYSYLTNTDNKLFFNSTKLAITPYLFTENGKRLTRISCGNTKNDIYGIDVTTNTVIKY